MKAVLNEVKLIRELSTEIKSVRTQPDSTVLLDWALLTPIGFLLVWAVVALMFLKIPKATRGKELALTRLQKVPCRGCQFFTNNPYLKCTVHPSTAMTDDAIDCTDYYARDRAS